MASRAISTFSPLPAFFGVKIDTKEDCLIPAGSDLDVSIQTKLTKSEECVPEIRDMGSVVIETEYILEIVRKIDADEIESEVIGGSPTKINGNTAEFRINGTRANECPAIDFSKLKECFILKKETLKKVILQTSFVTSDKETRPVLIGVNFRCEDNTLHCVATDSYRLAERAIDTGEPLNFSIIIPAKSLSEVAKILGGEGGVEIAVDDKKAQFIIHNTIVQTQLIDGVYSETSRLTPLWFDYELTTDSRNLLNTIDRVSFIKNDGVPVTKFSLSEQECVLSSKLVEVGPSIEVLNSISFVGSSLEISCNGRYIFDATKVLSGSLVTFRPCGEMKPFIIKSVDDDDALQLVLPVRTYA